MSVTRTYLVDEDPFDSLICPARALGLTTGRIFLIGDDDRCLVRCRSEADIDLIYLYLTGPDRRWQVAVVDGQIHVPSLWRDEIAEAIKDSPYSEVAQVLIAVDLSLPTANEHDRLTQAITSAGHYVEVRAVT